jgi:class 3 adenylate cyclase
MTESDQPAAWLEAPNGVRYPFVENFGLGRSRSNQVIITDDGVSRLHAMIQRPKPGEYWLFDLHSKNGTMVNGRRIFFPVKLQPGDSVEIGDQKLVFHRRPGETETGDESTKELLPTLVKVHTEPCWLLMADIEKSVQLSRRRAQSEWTALLHRWLEPCRTAIERADGRIDKHVGDGFLAFWRMGAVSPRKVAEAARALRGLQAAPEAPFRVVMHCGEAAFGGGLAPGEEITPCEAVDFIFRLEELAGAKGLDFCVSAAAHANWSDCLEMEEIAGEHMIRGLDGAHRIFRLA